MATVSGKYTAVPDEIMANIGGLDLLVWIALRSFLRWDPQGQQYQRPDCYPGHAAIAKKVRLSVTAVKKHLDSLAALGHITITPQVRGKEKLTNLYTFTDLAEAAAPIEITPQQREGLRDFIALYPYACEATPRQAGDIKRLYVRALKSTTHEHLMELLGRRLPEWWEYDQQYVPRAWNWLRNSPWLDEPEAYTTAAGPASADELLADPAF
jgi:DNA-binding MarR family transcriptional regulator